MNPTQTPTASDVTTEVTPADVLRGAAAYLAAHGWHQGTIFALDRDGTPFPPACTLGAICMALHGNRTDAALPPDNTEDARMLAAQRVLAAHIDPDTQIDELSAFHVIGMWNDDNDRDIEDVIAALWDAAKDWDDHHTGGAR